MTLRRKTLLIITLTLVALALLRYSVLSAILLDGFSTVEQQMTLRDLDRAVNSFQDDAASLGRGIQDWSSWNDTYTFTQDGNAAYINNNLDDGTFWTLKINLMMFVNNAHQIVYAKAADVDPTEQNHLLQDFKEYAQSDNRFLQLTTETITAGFVNVAGQPMLIASRPVLHSDGSGPSAGTLIWVRSLDAAELVATSQALRLSLDLRSLTAPDLPNDFRAAQGTLSLSTPQEVTPIDANTIDSYALLNDIYGQPAIILKTTEDRVVYQQEQVSLRSYRAALGIGSIILTAIVLLILDRLILTPLAHLSRHVRQIGVNNDFSLRLPVTGHDELAQLAEALNATLNLVSQSHAALQQLNTELESHVSERTLELNRQKSQLQAIMDTMGEGLVYSVDGLITYVNAAFVELTGYSVADLVGKPFSLLNAEVDPAQTPAYFRMPEHSETTLTRRDGMRVNIAITSTRVETASADHPRRVFIIRDITQELALKAQKDDFFARASHDLRSPLTSLLNRLYLLGKKPDDLERHLAILNHVANHMLELVNDLLDVSHIEKGGVSLERREVVLQSIIDDVVSVQAADAEVKQIELRAEMMTPPLYFYGDPLRLNQVITNLVSNALHYTPEGGHILIRVDQEDDEGAIWALVQVCDDGIGVSPENLDRIFEPFFRVSKERMDGSGLGLYIVKQIVELHGGTVSVRSEIGKGTTFSIRLPLSGSSHSTSDLSTSNHVLPV